MNRVTQDDQFRRVDQGKQYADAQARRLGRLAADLLDLSRIDAQVGLRSEPVELGELSRAVLAATRRSRDLAG